MTTSNGSTGPSSGSGSPGPRRSPGCWRRWSLPAAPLRNGSSSSTSSSTGSPSCGPNRATTTCRTARTRAGRRSGPVSSGWRRKGILNDRSSPPRSPPRPSPPRWPSVTGSCNGSKTSSRRTGRWPRRTAEDALGEPGGFSDDWRGAGAGEGHLLEDGRPGGSACCRAGRARRVVLVCRETLEHGAEQMRDTSSAGRTSVSARMPR